MSSLTRYYIERGTRIFFWNSQEQFRLPISRQLVLGPRVGKLNAPSGCSQISTGSFGVPKCDVPASGTFVSWRINIGVRVVDMDMHAWWILRGLGYHEIYIDNIDVLRFLI